MIRSIRNAFIAGLLVILPLGVTVIVINFLLERLGTPTSQLFFWFVDNELRETPVIRFGLETVSVLIVCLLITLLGYGSRFFAGKIILHGIDSLLGKVPLINSVYKTVRQIVDTFSHQNKAVFQEVVLIEYPRPQSYAIGFLTNTARGEVQKYTNTKLVNVFVPTTPNPTSGFLLMLPQEEVRKLNMTIADGMKLIISGGAVVPDLPMDGDKKDTSYRNNH